MKTWLTRDEALELLKVRPQTLYAYVSCGQIGMRPDPDDPRRSLYRAADISGLTRRRERGKRPAAIAASTIAWGEPIITTAISTVLRGRLYYRGRDVAELAETATLEEAAGCSGTVQGSCDFDSMVIVLKREDRHDLVRSSRLGRRPRRASRFTGGSRPSCGKKHRLSQPKLPWRSALQRRAMRPFIQGSRAAGRRTAGRPILSGALLCCTPIRS